MMKQTTLLFKNSYRWVFENIWVWGLLVVIYGYTLVLLLEPILEHWLHLEIHLGLLTALGCASLWFPGLLNFIPLPSLPLPNRIFSSAKFPGKETGRLYFRHEMRRGVTWLVIALMVLAGMMMTVALMPLWIFVAQISTQKAFFTFKNWQLLVLNHNPQRGAGQLLFGFLFCQSVIQILAWLALGFAILISRQLGFISDLTFLNWLSMGAGGLGAVISACTLAFEGDSGRPWLVNFISMTAGVIGGILSMAYPVTLVLIIYFAWRFLASSQHRIRSVEQFYEDAIFS